MKEKITIKDRIANFFKSKSGRIDARKIAISIGIVTTIVFAIMGLTSCEKTELVQDEYFPDIVKQHAPAFESEEKALLQIDTNIVDNYSGFGQYFPYIEYSSPLNPLPLENFIFGGNPYGDLRGAMDTVSGIKYRAYWFGAVYQGVFRDFIIFTLASDHDQNWVYTLNAPEPNGITVTGETFIQTPTGNNPYGYGTIKVYNSTVAINGTGPYDINPLIDSQSRLYTDAYWDLEVELIDAITEDTLKGRSYSFIRTEGIPPALLTGFERLKAADPLLAGGLFATYDIQPYEILYEGNLVTVFIYPGSLHSNALGAGNTSESRIIVQGFYQGDLINIPMSRFSKIIYKSNRGTGATYNAFE